ncbi:MAG: hypothetical protein JKX97_00795 [Candidatus Lindowbacteria bacterium]|nr:hypothetical protein [Candidatus Lindowbacteria bacterium]
MQKSSILSILLVLTLANAVSAAPVGYISPRKSRISVSATLIALTKRQTEHLGNTTMKVDGQYDALLGRVSYGISDQIEVYGQIGMADAGLHQVQGTRQFERINNSGLETAWGAGVQAIVFENPKIDWNIGIDLQYLETNNHSGVAANGTTAGSRWEFDVIEWHVAAQIQKSFRVLDSWIGIKYSKAKFENLIIAGVPQIGSLASEDPLGFYTGINMPLSENWSMYAEARIIDETALSGGARYDF